MASLAAMAAFAGLVEPAASQRGGARYAGSTSQGEGVTLHVSRSARTVTTLEARLVAFCRDRRPDRGVYQLAGIGIRGGAFAARQRLGSLAGARALLSVTGTFVRRGRVRGELDLLLRRPADEERVATRCRAHVSFTAQLPRSARTRFGALHQLQGPGSCFASRPQRGGCMIDPLFAETGGTSDLAISPDGRHVYAALGGPAEQDDAGAHLRSAVVVFVRNPATGRLHRLTGAAGCLREKGGEGCASARALRTVDAIEVSNDGRHIYVASGDGIAVLRRDPSTGALAQAPGPEGCVSFRNLPGCGAIRSWDSPFPFSSGFALGPRGHYAYLLGNGSLAVFTRARTTGALTQLADEAGCVRPKPADGCALGPSMRLFDTITVSPDGRHLYRMSTLEAPELQLLRRERGLRVLRAVRSRGGCFSDGGVMGCVPLRGVSYINDGAWSPDGRNLYGVSADEGIAIFARNGRTGGLRQLPGAAGCVVEAPDAGCGSARGVEGGGYPAVSPDGRNLYVNGGFSLAAFARDRRTGELLQLPGRAGCIADSLNDDYGRCAHPAQRNWGTEAMEVSPDGHHLYAIVGGFLTVYARRTQP